MCANPEAKKCVPQKDHGALGSTLPIRRFGKTSHAPEVFLNSASTHRKKEFLIGSNLWLHATPNAFMMMLMMEMKLELAIHAHG
ncbi:hypothetical protein EBR21_17460 [bacterium]|nr:hypothetical protein [bacterium]